jgi:hypothetical protein
MTNDASAATAVRPQPGPGTGRIPVLEILADPVVVRIAVLAAGVAALLLTIATML